MAQPRGRRPARGDSGGGYSSRPQARGRTNGGYGARGNGGYGGGGGGNSQMPLIIGLAAAGVVALVLIIILLSGGDDKRGTEVEATNGNATAPRRNPPVENPGVKRPPPRTLEPLSPDEVSRINARIDDIARRLPEARRLKEEGFQAKKDGNDSLAKAKWREAEKVTRSMIEEANVFFEEFGAGLLGEERIEKFARRSFTAVGQWTKLRSDFLKYVSSE